MADNGRWFKLWCSVASDPDLDNLDIADFGRWAKLGAFIKEHGERGTIIVESPARLLCSMMQILTFNELVLSIYRLPNVYSECANGKLIVTFLNWRKYQEDSTVSERVTKWRAKNVLTGQEEKRREENNTCNGELVVTFEKFWKSYPRRVAKQAAQKAWIKISPQNGLVEKIISAVESYSKTDQWKKDNGKFIPYPATWLNQKRWEDEIGISTKQGDPGLSSPKQKEPGL